MAGIHGGVVPRPGKRVFLMKIKYFEDIEVGAEDTNGVVYAVTREDVIEFARRWDPRPFHLDESAASASIFGGLVACSAHVFSIFSWFSTQGETRTASLAALGFDEVGLHAPVRPGDRIHCSMKCLEKRESRSKLDRGIVRFGAVLSNQDGTAVFSAIANILVAKRPGVGKQRSLDDALPTEIEG
jgi:acyl dehydratase